MTELPKPFLKHGLRDIKTDFYILGREPSAGVILQNEGSALTKTVTAYGWLGSWKSMVIVSGASPPSRKILSGHTILLHDYPAAIRSLGQGSEDRIRADAGALFVQLSTERVFAVLCL
jgi:hypothetical protein